MRLAPLGLAAALSVVALVDGCLLTSDFGGLSDGTTSSSSSGTTSSSSGTTSSSSSGSGGGASCGVCQPIRLSLGGVPSSVAVDASRIYWSDTDEIRYRSKNLADNTILPLAQGLPHVGDLVLRGGALYFTTHDDATSMLSVMRFVLPSGPAKPLATVGGKSGGLALDNQFVFLISITASSSTLYKVPMSETLGEMATLADPFALSSIAVDGERIYGLLPEGGKIQSLQKDGSDLHDEVTKQSHPGALLVADGGLFWGNDGAPDGGPFGAIFRRPPGGAQILVASGQDHPSALALTDGGLAWTTAGSALNGGTIVHEVLPDKAPKTLAVGVDHPSHLIAYDQTVYWITGDLQLMQIDLCCSL